MPFRITCRIERQWQELRLNIPPSILTSYDRHNWGDGFEIQINRHYDRSGRQIQEINTTIDCFGIYEAGTPS